MLEHTFYFRVSFCFNKIIQFVLNIVSVLAFTTLIIIVLSSATRPVSDHVVRLHVVLSCQLNPSVLQLTFTSQEPTFKTYLGDVTPRCHAVIDKANATTRSRGDLTATAQQSIQRQHRHLHGFVTRTVTSPVNTSSVARLARKHV